MFAEASVSSKSKTGSVPDSLILPATSNFSSGLLVPIPTLPSESIRIRSVTLVLADDVAKAISPSSLFTSSAPLRRSIRHTPLPFHSPWIRPLGTPAALSASKVTLGVLFPVVRTLIVGPDAPTTSSNSLGLLVPIPTLPLELIRMYSLVVPSPKTWLPAWLPVAAYLTIFASGSRSILKTHASLFDFLRRRTCEIPALSGATTSSAD